MSITPPPPSPICLTWSLMGLGAFPAFHWCVTKWCRQIILNLSLSVTRLPTWAVGSLILLLALAEKYAAAISTLQLVRTDCSYPNWYQSRYDVFDNTRIAVLLTHLWTHKSMGYNVNCCSNANKTWTWAGYISSWTENENGCLKRFSSYNWAIWPSSEPSHM